MRLVVITCVLLAWAFSVSAQGTPPTRTPAATTAAQEATLRAGIDLHDQGKFDEAIAKYREVLAASPANVTALFELAFSYLAKKDYEQSFAAARAGAEYRSDLLPMFYDLMASVLDSQGKPQQAIEMYKSGLSLAPEASQLYYNMAVTYRESLNQPNEARLALQKAAAIEPLHPGVHLLLGQVYQATGYDAPAFLALSTFLAVDPRGSQSLTGYGLWRAILKGGVDPVPEQAGGPAAMRNPSRPRPRKTDEGDFAAFDAQLAPTHDVFMKKIESGTPEIQALVAQVDQLLGTLQVPDRGPATASFVNTQYVPFFVALRQRHYVEPFVYWASQRAPVPGVTDWLKANEPRVREFVDWASRYSWPAP